MALDKLTIINNGGLSTTSDYRVGVLTATKFVGPIESNSATFNGSVSIGGTLTYEDVTNIDSVGIITARDGIDCNGDLDVDGHTELDNLRVSGIATVQDDLHLPDASKLLMGDNNEFRIYHNESNQLNYIVAHNNAPLLLRSRNADMIHCSPQGAVALKYNGGTRATTSSSGFDVSGTLNVTGVSTLGSGASGQVRLDYQGNQRLKTHTWGVEVSGALSATNIVAGATDSTFKGASFSGAIDANGDLDVDGHTNLDNVSVSGVTTAQAFQATTGTFTGDVSIADKIVHTGNTGTAIRFPGNDIITMERGGTEIFRLDGAGLKIPDKLIHQADTDTAIRFPADDTVTVETAGTERLRISGIGSISIGSGANGQRKVDIVTGGDNGVLIRPTTSTEGSQGSSGSIQDLIQLRTPWGSSAHNTGNAGARFGIQMRASNINGDFNTKDPAKSAAIYAVSEDEHSGYWKNVGLAFYTSAYNQSQAEKVRIDTNGKVGIGSAIPQAQLDVTAGGVNNAVFLKTFSDKSLIEFENTAGSTYNTRIGSATLGVGNVGLMFETGTSGSRLQAMVIDRYGKVGIGSAIPAEKLDVTGNIKFGTVQGTNTNAALNVLFQTADGVIDGGSQLTYNPAQDVLSVNGNHISAQVFRGDGALGTLTCDNHSSTTSVNVSNTVNILTNDNATDAFTVKQGSNEYITVDTTNSSELITLGNSTTNPKIVLDNAVGIHTTTPAAPLEIQGDNGVNNAAIYFTRHGNPPNNGVIGQLLFRKGTDSVAIIQAQKESANDDAYISMSTQPTGGNVAERLRINSSGSVSIGNNPTVHIDTIFHVEKSSGETNVIFEGNDTMGARLSLQNNDTSSTANNQINFKDAGGQATSAIIGYNTDQTNNYGELVLATRSAQGTPPEERLRIASNGYVGIRTENPSALLNINTFASGSNDAIVISRDSYGMSGKLVNASGSLQVISNKQLVLKSDPSNQFTAAGSYIGFETDGTEKVRIDSSGRSLFKTNGSQTSPLADNNVPVQIAESSASMCYFGANKGNSYGSIFGHHTAYGGTVIRNVVSDDIVFYTNSTQQKLRIGSNGISAFTGRVTATGTIESTGTGAGVGGKFGQIQVGTGTLYNTIQNTVANTPIHLQYNNSGDIKCNEGGGDLRTKDIIPHTNNAQDLGTSSLRYRSIFASNALDMGDNAKVQLGNSDDLQLYHSSSNAASYIQNSTGNLFIEAPNSSAVKLRKKGTSETMIVATAGGAVDLYYNNGLKFQTKSDGVKLYQGHFYADDSSQIRLGNSQDLKIYHDGTYNRIESGATTLFVRSNLIEIGDNSGNKYIKCIDGGATELYHNSTKKFETYQYGIKTTQNIMIGTHAYWEDNGEAIFGDGSDLKIYHNGSHTYIDNKTGNLYIQANTDGDVGGDIHIRAKSGENSVSCLDDGAVKLYFDNSEKLATTTGGVEITNANGVANLTVKGTGSNRADVRVLATGSGNANVYLDASNGDLSGADYAVLQHKNDLNLALVNYAADIEMYVRGGSLGTGGLRKCFHAHENGATELYYNGNKKLQTTSTGVDIDGTTDGVLNIDTTDGRGSFIRLQQTGNTKVWVGSSEGFGVGDQDDGALMAIDNIHLMSSQTRRLTINGSGMAEIYGGQNSYPWGASFKNSGESNGYNSVRCFFEGTNGQSNRTYSIMSENGKFRISGGGTAGSSTGSQLVYLNSTSSTSWSSGSDERLKENITEIPSVLNKIKNYRCARFNFKGDDASDIENIKFGFIAQDWVDDFPEVLSTSTQDADDPTDTTEYYGMQYTETIPVLLKAIQELNAKVETLQNEVNTLKSS